jgi:hypothetical protein
VYVRLHRDTRREATETIVLTLKTPAGAALGFPDRMVIRVMDRLCPEDDTDGDGLPDEWEQKYFGNLNQNGEDDADGDGWTNRREYQLGARPTKPWRTDTENQTGLAITGIRY